MKKARSRARLVFAAGNGRSRRGASLVLVLAIFGGLALIILLFCLGFTGLIGSYHEQRSAVEAAALAAAKDLSAIVIEDPNFGFIGLSDSPPVASATAAGDGFDTSVTGINTLFGTIRLDMIIADCLQDPIMTKLAQSDYQNALTAQQNLQTAIVSAAAANGTGKDASGVVLNPTQDAINAYNSNNVHLAIGQTSALVPGSLKLALGYVDNLVSRTPIPQPQVAACLASDNLQSQGLYMANQVINYAITNNITSGNATVPFVFAALGPNATLVDFAAFQSSLQGLPYSTPTVVKVDADEQYVQNGVTTRTVHATAAAEAGTIVDQRPNPGAFTITFTDGTVPEITQLGDLINNSQIQTDPTDVMQTPLNGDYPQTALSFFSMPFLPDPDPFHPALEHVLSVSLYDWLRRAGTNINVQSLVTAMQTPMNYGGGGPQIQRFHLTSSGAVTNDSVAFNQQNLCVSNNQYRAISGLGLDSTNKNYYDLEITDYGRLQGRSKGGLHAGEPLDVPGTIGSNPASASYVSGTIYENSTWGYQQFLSGSGVRPTYNREGVACNFTVRQRH